MCQFNLIGEQLVACFVNQPDVAAGDDPARIAIPHHFIGAHRSVFGTQDHIAARGDGVGFVVVAEFGRFEVDLARGWGRFDLNRGQFLRGE